MSWWRERTARKRADRLRDLKTRTVRTRDALRKEQNAASDAGVAGGLLSRRLAREINRILVDAGRAIPAHGPDLPDPIPIPRAFGSPQAVFLAAHVALAQLALVLDAVRSSRNSAGHEMLLAQRVRILAIALEREEIEGLVDSSVVRLYERLRRDAARVRPELGSPMAVNPHVDVATLRRQLGELTDELGHPRRHE